MAERMSYCNARGAPYRRMRNGYAFGPTRSSRTATLLRCETEMLRAFDCVQRTPSRPHAAQNSARMSADRLLKKYRGYAYSATRPLGKVV